MTTLRVRVAALLIVAIVAVVGLATAAAVAVIGPPRRDGPLQALAAQARVLQTLAAVRRDPAASIPVVPRPAGEIVEPLTALLQETLADGATPLAAEVLAAGDPQAYTLAVPAGDGGYLTVPIDGRPPPAGGWPILVGWMGAIVVGVAGVALVGARWLTRPLAILEDAVAGVGADGALAVLPETGPAEVRATAAALNRLSERLQAAVASRMRLVAAAGHDLRTPITRLRLRAEFLPDAERPSWLADLDELERIADSAIELVREEAGGGGEPIRLDVLAAEVVAELAGLGLPIVMSARDPVVVSAHPLALKRALRNLVANAATHGGGACVAVVADTSAAAPTALLRIDDDGPGIPPEQLARAFEPFFRVDPARRRSAPGAGLGLAIAREIVSRAGGEIRLTNRPEGGLRQEVVLPLA